MTGNNAPAPAPAPSLNLTIRAEHWRQLNGSKTRVANIARVPLGTGDYHAKIGLSCDERGIRLRVDRVRVDRRHGYAVEVWSPFSDPSASFTLAAPLARFNARAATAAANAATLAGGDVHREIAAVIRRWADSLAAASAAAAE